MPEPEPPRSEPPVPSEAAADRAGPSPAADRTGPSPSADRTGPSPSATLADAERAGLRLALRGRTVALIPVAAWYGGVGAWSFDPLGAAAVGVFILAGLVHLRLIAAGLERPWHRYAFLSLDAAGLFLIVVLTPLSTGGDVPQILVFRAYGTYFSGPTEHISCSCCRRSPPCRSPRVWCSTPGSPRPPRCGPPSFRSSRAWSGR